MNNLLVATVLSSAAIAAVSLQFIGEYIYDIRRIRARKQQAHADAATPPLVTIIIQTHNDHANINACLASILQSSYISYQIVIVDNASTDDTVRQLRTIAAQYPDRIGRIVAKRKFQPLKVRELIRRYAKGEIVLFMTSPHLLDKQALTQLTQHFAHDQQLTWLGLRTEQAGSSWIFTTAQKYAGVMQHSSRKLTGWPQLTSLDKESIFVMRRTNTRTKAGDSHMTGYADNAWARCLRQPLPAERIRLPKHGSLPRRRGAHLARLTAMTLIPILCSSFILLAIAAQDITLFLYGWVIFTTMLVISIAGDKDLSLRRKLGYFVHIIPAYLLVGSYFIAISLLEFGNLLRRKQNIPGWPGMFSARTR